MMFILNIYATQVADLFISTAAYKMTLFLDMTKPIKSC